MQLNLSKYKNLKICVAVSGGKDSMALLHYLNAHGKEYGITLSALNCDHKIRGEQSAADSAFVREYCQTNGIPLLFFEYNEGEMLNESRARLWRWTCYTAATSGNATLPDGTPWQAADVVATAHHLNDNAETVLFNIARGSGIAGAAGISDDTKHVTLGVKLEGKNYNGSPSTIHPLISVSREEIDGYIRDNNIPYVTDETNLTDDYTRNKIRYNVLPELEKAVPGAAKSIYRFSRIAQETEDYFDNLIKKKHIISGIYGGQIIKNTKEKAVFERAALKVFYDLQLKDYTYEHIEKLYELQFAENGKKFEFLDLIAQKEEKGISVISKTVTEYKENGMPFSYVKGEEYGENYFGEFMFVGWEKDLKEDLRFLRTSINGFKKIKNNYKVLKFDRDKIPDEAVIRFRRQGDTFTKFGGGTKKLGDYFTDIKLPQRLRDRVPLVCAGSDVLLIFGVEISDKIKVTDATNIIATAISADYRNM